MPTPSPVREYILTALQTGRMSVAQLCEELKMERSVISASVRRTKQAKLIRIAGWLQRHGIGGQRWVPLYGLGANPDVPCPEPMTPQQKSAGYREKHRARIRAKQRKTVNPWLDLLR